MIRRPPKSPLFPYTTLSRSLKFSGGVGKANSPLQQLMDIRQAMTANGDGNKKIWATEYGQPASSGGEAKENEYIADILLKWQEVAYARPKIRYTARALPARRTSKQTPFG